LAALELGRRRQASEPKEREVIRSSKDAYHVFYPQMADLPHEEFCVLLTNRAARVITVSTIGRGSIQGVVVDIRLIVKMALENHASGIILCHNHPSGNPHPSEEDKKLTKSVKEAAALFNIALHDHIIIAEKRYFSFADENLM
jgi:DNA repair protein RadC